MTIRSAQIEYNSQGTPIATDFDDVYFSNQDGLAESEYVFIKNNDLIQRWQQTKSPDFVIAETGFGTGLNLLAVWRAFDQFRRQHSDSPLKTLHFISTEKFPLQKHDLQAALQQWPDLIDYSEALIENYPVLLPGCHRLSLANGQVILDLWLGDIQDTLPTMQCTEYGLVDAWFLDGFAPSKNPQMWSDELFTNMARLSKPSGTFATFTAAGLVKRGLAHAGFSVKKVKGFGRKREMLVGTLAADHHAISTHKIHYRSPAQLTTASKIAVVGAGIAGANLVYRLTQQGFDVHWLSKQDSLADGASGNPQGGFYPQLNAQFNLASQIQACSFDYAWRFYNQLFNKGYEFAHQWCGVLQLAFNQNVAQRQQKLLEKQLWPETLIRHVDAEQATRLANISIPYDALFMPQGGWISPPDLVKAMYKAARDTNRLTLKLNCRVDKLTRLPNSWEVQCAEETLHFDCVVYATGTDTRTMPFCHNLPIQTVRGQVEAIDSQTPLSGLNTVLCHKGYLTPAYQGQHALGSTYVKNDSSVEYRLLEQNSNLKTHQQALSETEWAKLIEGQAKGRASGRASLPDHLPVVGSVFEQSRQAQQFENLYKALAEAHYPLAESLPNLYVLSGLGSRGLTTAPLMAELLVSQMLAKPLPLPAKLLANLNPNRFVVKALIRRQPLPNMESDYGASVST